MGVIGGCVKTEALDVNEATQETNTVGGEEDGPGQSFEKRE